LDSRFTWARDEGTANFFPRLARNNSNYLLNRELHNLVFNRVPDAQKAVFETVRHLPGPQEQLAVLMLGGSVAFAKPWTATFSNLNVRRAFNRIARQLGPTAGWNFGGTEEFRFVTFHTRLAARPKSDQRK
jgi:hypothetical protein